MARIKTLYARYEKACDACGNVTSKGMAIYDSSHKFLGYIPYPKYRIEKERYIDICKFHGKAMVKLLPPLKRN